MTQLIAGCAFLGLSFYFLWLAHRSFGRRLAQLSDGLAMWRRRNPWSGFAYALVLAGIGLWSLSRAIPQLANGQRRVPDDLIGGIVFLFLGILAALRHKQLTRWAAEADERWAHSLRQHPRIMGTVFLIAGAGAALIGVAMLCYGTLGLFESQNMPIGSGVVFCLLMGQNAMSWRAADVRGVGSGFRS